MTKNNLWISDSKGEEGDFSDVESHYEYQVGNLTDAVQAEAKALERGDRVEWVDEAYPCDNRDSVIAEPGQNFTLWESSQDSQGVDYPRRK